MNPAPDPKKSRLGRIVGAAFLSAVLFAAAIAGLALFHPDSSLPDGLNPMRPLVVTDPVTPLTSWKLSNTLADPAACLTALETGATFVGQEPVQSQTDACGIANPVELRGVGSAAISPSPIQTSCAIALRTAMWQHHALQPAAREILNTEVTQIDHIGSYNCRPLRSLSGETERWSTHATADAIDIAGFGFSDGTRLRLVDDWDGVGDVQGFLRHARDSACTWFRVTLSPDYNSLHADHFHLQSKGWGLCR